MNISDRSGESGPPGIPLFTKILATGFFAGYVPGASGTAGTLVGILIALIPGIDDPPVLASLVLVGFVAGVITAGTVAKVVGHQLTPVAAHLKKRLQTEGTGHPDPSIVVIDEIVGMWVALLWIPKAILPFTISFLLFRAFDILKPQPARLLERLPGGWGIMLDDVVAGIYANLICHLLLILIESIAPSLL